MTADVKHYFFRRKAGGGLRTLSLRMIRRRSPGLHSLTDLKISHYVLGPNYFCWG